MIVLFINCNLFPFIDWIISGLKLYETRNRNTLKNIIGKKVYIAETGKRKKPVVRCMVTIDSVLRIDDKRTYNSFRKETRIKRNCLYDWNRNTRHKYLYKLSNVKPVNPFFLPDNAVYHGRIYATVNDTEGR